MLEIKVNLPNEPYSIVIEPGILSRLGEMVRSVAPHARCLLAVDSNIAATHGQIARASLEQAGYQTAVVGVLARESAKTLATAQMLYAAMLEARLERGSPVIALGGGIVGDVAGFAAATFLRGVPLVQVPTTLLAMVDAAIGGKTGVNFPLPESNDLGKNLIGAFWQPKVVLADPEVLLTLQRRDFVCGLAECIKHAVIADAAFLQWLNDHAKEILGLFIPTWVELITRSAAIKASIVVADVREHDRRALLNLGHTFAHALESINDLDIRHGEAVAIGLDAASYVAKALGRLGTEEGRLIERTIMACGLSGLLPRIIATIPLHRLPDEDSFATALNNRVTVDRLMHAMAFDKKVADGRIRLVLPRGIGAADVIDDIPLDLVRQAWLHIGAAK